MATVNNSTELSVIAQLTEAAIGNPSVYAQLVAQTALAGTVGSVSMIPDGEEAAALETAILTSPTQIKAFQTAIADQMNKRSAGPTFTDLADRIADIIIDDQAQGASTLQLLVIDPALVLQKQPDENGNTFIMADANGRLLPLDINWPVGTDCWWRLCQIDSTWNPGMGQANVTLTFEDRIVSWLREVNADLGGVSQGTPGETLAGFIGSLIKGANRYLRGHPDTGGTDFQPIRFVSLIADNDPNYVGPVVAPASANPTSALARQNPDKTIQGLTKAQQAQVKAYQQHALQGPESSFQAVEAKKVTPPTMTVGAAKTAG